MIDKKAMSYWKYSSAIILFIFFLTIGAVFLTIINRKLEIIFFTGLLQSFITQKNWSHIITIIAAIASYLYLLFYMERHQAFIMQEETKEAKIIIKIFMFFRIINYIAPIFIIYLLFVKVYSYALILFVAFAMTDLVFKPIMGSFNSILSNYRSLELLDTTNIIGPLQKAVAQSKSDIKNFWVRVKNKDKSQSMLKTLLLPYKDYIPAFIYGNVRQIIKIGGPQVKNSIIILIFLTILIMLPFGFNAVNVIAIVYIELTLFYWFLTSSIIFSKLPEGKVNVKLKDGKHYYNVYCTEDNPRGYHLYLNSNNEVVKVANTDIEEETLIKSKDLTHIKDLEERISDKFTYLPIYCIENFNLSLEHVEKELKNPGLVTWHSKDVLEETLRTDINGAPDQKEVSEIINQFVVEFDKITIELYKNYKIAYEKLENLTENDKILMLGLYNTLLECGRVYWPNIYNTIQENPDLSEKYDSLAKQLDNIEELQNYKKLVEEAREMKDKYLKLLGWRENIMS